MVPNQRNWSGQLVFLNVTGIPTIGEKVNYCVCDWNEMVEFSYRLEIYVLKNYKIKLCVHYKRRPSTSIGLNLKVIEKKKIMMECVYYMAFWLFLVRYFWFTVIVIYLHTHTHTHARSIHKFNNILFFDKWYCLVHFSYWYLYLIPYAVDISIVYSNFIHTSMDYSNGLYFYAEWFASNKCS